MGYKLAGYEHLGGVEIDPKIADVYKENHQPKHLFVEDIREFNKRNDLPEALFDLDLLDGSPPCTVFSSSGLREYSWGKEKKFREGQQIQTLDDLVFEYCDTILKLQPKTFILENVKGIIIGNAKMYSKQIIKRLNNGGYKTQIFLLNSASMGVPQKRERVFFIGYRKDLQFPKLSLNFSETPILFGKLRSEGQRDNSFTEYDLKIWKSKRYGDKDYSDVLRRVENRDSNWNAKFIYDNQVCQTILSSYGSKLISFKEPKHLSNDELKAVGTFPMDYNFLGNAPKYIIGMSVPPIMTAQIAHQVYLQWFKKM